MSDLLQICVTLTGQRKQTWYYALMSSLEGSKVGVEVVGVVKAVVSELEVRQLEAVTSGS